MKESAGRKKGNGSTGHGNRYLARVLGEAAVGAAGPTPSSANATGASPDGAGRRRPSSRSADPSWSSSGTCSTTPRPEFLDLGPDYYDHRRGTQRAIRTHIRQLQALGYQVTLEPAA